MVIFVLQVNSSVPTRRCAAIFMFVSLPVTWFSETCLFKCHWAHLDINIDIGAGLWLEVHLFFSNINGSVWLYLSYWLFSDADETNWFSHPMDFVEGHKNPTPRANHRFPLSLNQWFWIKNDLSPSLPKVFLVIIKWAQMSWLISFFAGFHMFIPEVVFTAVMFFIFACSHVEITDFTLWQMLNLVVLLPQPELRTDWCSR